MKNIITNSAVAALLLTSVHADFNFGDVFKDMKKSTVKAPNNDFVFGDVFKDMNDVKITKTSAVKAPNTDFVFGDVFKDMKES